MSKLLTLEEIRTALRAAGKTQADLAREISAELGVPVDTVTKFLCGRLSGMRGDARRIRVRLGMAHEDKSALEIIDAAKEKGTA